MKKVFFFLLIAMVLASCRKEDSHSDIPASDYRLSDDGLTLIRWNNRNTPRIDMQADSKLREVNTIGEGAFKGCEHLRAVTFSDNLKEIEAEAFAETDLSEALLFNSYSNVVLGEKAFYHSKIREVVLPKTKALPNHIFANCKHLKEVTFKETGLIGEGAFYACEALEQVDLTQAGVKGIGKEAFANCQRLKKVLLSVTMNLKPIGDKAFAHCTSLKHLTILALYPPYFEGDPFLGIPKATFPKIYVPSKPEDLIDTYKRDPYWRALADYIQVIP